MGPYQLRVEGHGAPISRVFLPHLPIYFRPFIGVMYNSTYNDRLRGSKPTLYIRSLELNHWLVRNGRWQLFQGKIKWPKKTDWKRIETSSNTQNINCCMCFFVGRGDTCLNYMEVMLAVTLTEISLRFVCICTLQGFQCGH